MGCRPRRSGCGCIFCRSSGTWPVRGDAGKVQDYRVHRMSKTEPNPLSKRQHRAGNKPPARSTLHDEIVTLRLVLKAAIRHGWLAHLPDLSPPYKTQGQDRASALVQPGGI